jgi:hypothetical protein
MPYGLSFLQSLSLHVDIYDRDDPEDKTDPSGKAQEYDCQKYDQSFLPLPNVEISYTSEQAKIQYQSKYRVLFTGYHICHISHTPILYIKRNLNSLGE